jgi:hypothetical protein
VAGMGLLGDLTANPLYGLLTPSPHQCTLIRLFDPKVDQISIQIHVFEAIQKLPENAMCNKVILKSSDESQLRTMYL